MSQTVENPENHKDVKSDLSVLKNYYLGMEDYVHEINTALEIEGSSRYFESMDEVEQALKEKQREHRERGLKYSTAALTLLGIGFASDNYSEFLEEFLSDDIGRVALTGGLAASSIPAYLGHKHKNNLNDVRNALSSFESENYDENTELAYQIVDVLER